MRPIRDFIEVWKYYDRKLDSERRNRLYVNWNDRFSVGGYHKVTISNDGSWAAMHEWCRKTVGEKNYAWAGSTFWFEKEEDAIEFTLRWK